MAKLSRIFQPLLILGLIAGMLASPAFAWAQTGSDTSNQYTQPDSLNTDWQISQEIPPAFELSAENDTFQLYFDKTSLAFKVLDKRSGYIWHSTLDGKIKGDRLNKTWTAFANSGVSIDYLDQKAQSKRNSITNAPVTINVQPVEQGVVANVTFTDPAISLTVIVKLEPSGVSVEVPFDSIKENNPEFKLGLMYVYPFFGATRTNTVPGYMFIPDGSGSLIRFSESTVATNMFYARYYGDDLGMITVLPWDPNIIRPYRMSIPVFGMVHGYKQNAFLSIVEKGAAYGEIEAHPAGVITNFNFIYSSFVYNESYFQATNRSGAGVTTLQQKTNQFDVKIHYRFMTGAESDYVGMARSYRQYLQDRGDLKKVTAPGGDIGIRLEFLGGEKEKVLFWYRLIPMTTVRQMQEILAGLGIKTPEVVLYGWQRLGASSMPPKTFELDRGLGSKVELRSLIDKITADGGKFYLYYDPQAAIYWEKTGYSPRNDLALSITDDSLLGYNRAVNYYFNLKTLSQRYSSLSSSVSSELNTGLALDGIGSILYSDFKASSVLNRENAITGYTSLLAERGGSNAFYRPNDYAFRFADAYFDMPLTNSGYMYTTDSVPFLQIVFSGYIPYYGKALNFSSNTREDLLRLIDYGEYPAYFLTAEPTAKILLTPSDWIYSSSYQQWGPEIKQTYQWLNSLLAPVKGQSIVSRDVLAPGVVATTYDNGKRIVVNYTESPFDEKGVTINAQDAVITEVQP